MDRNSSEFKQLVYDLMNGSIDLKEFPIKESRYIADEYGEGKYCEEKYQQIYNANRRLCERLKIPGGEDDDVECIISGLLDIQKHLCMKMYEYGRLFALMEKG